MAHHRLRKFNTKKTYPEQKIDNDLCMSVRATGTHVFLRGQVGQDLQGRMVGVGDPAAQAEQAMKNVKTLLEEQGARLEDICKITVYITDRAYRDAVYRVIGKWLKGVFPVSTGLIVQGLARPEWVMEIDAWAVIPDQRVKRRASAPAARHARRSPKRRP
ncbi:MAG TPA: RidA family protein [Dongiaceae bacterium]|jgi:enamine deaminase RidA (YjgF/YER057c/UK114 family)|nr:RidA family protein [Dongiaceae bacterium]